MPSKIGPTERAHPLHMRRWIAAALILALLVMLYLLLRPGTAMPESPNPWNGPVPVRLVQAHAQTLVEHSQSIGTVTALQTVTVRSKVSGTLMRVLFEEGQEVRRGQVLAEIDPAPYRVALSKAEGNLQQLRAELAHADLDLARYRTLYQQDSVARQQLESQQALAAQLRGSVQAAQAEVDDARLQLSYTQIEAPISGRLGLRQLDAGNLVASGDSTDLVTITQTQPISLIFTLPEQQIDALREAWQQARASGHRLEVEAWDRNEKKRLGTGHLVTLDNQIDTSTATLKLKAQFDNPDDALFPNQFVNVRLQLRSFPKAITVPVDAVQHGAQGDYVYVVQDGIARRRPVRTGLQENVHVAILEGLTAGENVVLEGLDRLNEGSKVVVVDPDHPHKTAAQLLLEQPQPTRPADSSAHP